MSLDVAALIGCAATLALAILRRNQFAVLLAVVAYATLVGWIIRDNMALVMPALGLAIALAMLGLAVLLSHDDESAEGLPAFRQRRRGEVGERSLGR